MIDQTLTDSFPAGDPPCWTLGRERHPDNGVSESREENMRQGPSSEKAEPTPILTRVLTKVSEPIAVRKQETTMSHENKICITEFDMKRLKGLIKFAEERWNKRVVQYLDGLDKELDRAEVFMPEEIPTDVITMNSTFRLRDLDSGEETVYTLVFPAMADSMKGKISILAPVGTAVLGCRVGDTVEWEVPSGLKKLRVKRIIYQPEAAGDFYC